MWSNLNSWIMQYLAFHSLLNMMRDFECDRDARWTWLIFDVPFNVNVWNVLVEYDVWPWIWSRCLLNLINFHVSNASVVVECDRYPWMWSNLNSWILHHLAYHSWERTGVREGDKREWRDTHVSLARPVLSLAHYFQVPAMQAILINNK